jgi:hypothetical protein
MSSSTEAEAGSATATPDKDGEIRLSFGLFYVVLKWGTERRSSDRIDDDRRQFPALTYTHAPVLFGVWIALVMALCFALQLAMSGLVYTIGS